VLDSVPSRSPQRQSEVREWDLPVRVTADFRS
jgi:hypothetical protein